MSNYKLNLEGNGEPIAIIKNKNSKNKHVPILYLGQEARNGEESIDLKNNECFQQVPNVNKERDILFIFGQSGSGKSYYTMNYAKSYNDIYPKRNVYLFSTITEDKEIDSVKKLNRIKLDDAFLEDDDIPIEEFKDSLVIFDDVDNISNKKLKKKVWTIMNNILQCGRHYNISCIITYHVSCNGNETKLILNEAHSITFFSASAGNRSLKYILDSYLGLDKNQIKKVKSLDSRWTTVIKSYPKVILSEKEAYILRN
jgi:hypothetical protein